MAEIYWRDAGILPFVRNDVPYLVNNTGRLSENSAALVFAALEESRSQLPDRLVVFELGAGTGLHARYFLDAFATLCAETGRDYLGRLTYIVSDRFDGTVAGWEDMGLFAEHSAFVQPRICDAITPSRLVALDGTEAPWPGAPMAILCNYILDVLPSRIVRRSSGGLEELYIRTHLADGPADLGRSGCKSLEDVRRLAGSGQPEDLARLVPLFARLEFETAFKTWEPGDALESALASGVPPEGRVIANVGALRCLKSLLELVHPLGFVLVNDYGPTRSQDVDHHIGVQRFGGSVAHGLNFPMLEQVMLGRGMTVLAPEGDEKRRVHTRLIARKVGDRVRDTLLGRFGLEAERHLDAPLEEARKHIAAGRSGEALISYRELIRRNPRDWQMLGEAAEYAGLQLRDYSAGLALVRTALERNPWCSAWLWNVLGDCLFYMDKIGDAHEAFLQAERIDAGDSRTNLNLAYTFFALGDEGEALAAIARGLAQDGRGNSAYRTRLLEKQGQILSVLSQRATVEQARLIKRRERFLDASRGPDT